ncbi:acyltransferase family protein [Leucobacter musarum]|uniref:acyltransferase family protein n=1 Tax=Leucobacter musarum TaxID=1930747 RepID=UPI00138F92BD|nr:acyltransferase [Leucobacter musarum]
MVRAAQTSVSRRPRFLLLDLLRLLAAIAVLWYHYTARNSSAWDAAAADEFGLASRFTAYGFLGVQLFFVISGFVILLSAEGRSLGQFVSARVSRLYPAYWAGVLLTTFLIVVVTPQFDRQITFADVLTNLTMLQTAFGVRHIDGVYWTLWIELLFYVLIALLISVRLTEAKVLAFTFLWPVIGAIASTSESTFLTALLSPAYASLFAGGMVLYLIHSRGHSLLRWLLLIMNVCLAVQQSVTQSFMVAVPRDTEVDPSASIGSVLVVLIFVIVALVTITPLKHAGWSWMTYAGSLTYPLYLVHEYWGWWVISTVDPIVGKWGAVAAAFAVSFGLAIIIERWVERPLRPRIRRALQRSFDALPSTTHHRDDSRDLIDSRSASVSGARATEPAETRRDVG